MPPMKAIGTKTEARNKAIPITGLVTSSIALTVASFGDKSMLDVVFDGLDNDDCIVHDEANGEDQAEQREVC